MTEKELSRREFLRVLILSTTAAAALTFLPQGAALAASTPPASIKGMIYLFMKGSFLDLQFGKNPDLHKNPAIEKTIQNLALKTLKPEGFPYSGANSANWLFVFDLSGTPPAPLTLTLTNQAGVKIEVEITLFEGTRYVGVLRGADPDVLNGLFVREGQNELTLSLMDRSGKTLWEGKALKPFRPRGGGSGDNSGNDQSGGGSGDGNGGDEQPPGGPGE